MATSAPSRAKRAATARPMPLSAPVIRATLPCRRPEPGYRGSHSGLGSSCDSWPGWSSRWTWVISGSPSTCSCRAGASVRVSLICSLLRRDAGAFLAEGFDGRFVLPVLLRLLLRRRRAAVAAESRGIAAAVAGIVGHLVVLVERTIVRVGIMLILAHDRPRVAYSRLQPLP